MRRFFCAGSSWCARRRRISAMLTMRNWMFIKQYYRELRRAWLLKPGIDLRGLMGDLSSGAFDEMSNDLLSVGCVDH